MAMIHAILDGSSTMYWDNDALNMAGVCTTTDLDNGQLVTLKKINRVTGTGAVEGFEAFDFFFFYRFGGAYASSDSASSADCSTVAI